MIQITQAGLEWTNRAKELAGLTHQFSAVHCVRLERFLDARLTALVCERISGSQFRDELHAGVASDQGLTDEATTALLHLLVNDEDVLSAVREITGTSVAGFSGRVYRMIPGAGHHDSWHSDATDDRMVGISINLSPGTYSGGLFQLRRVQSEQILYEVANIGPGDAILFRIDREFVHRVSPLEGTSAKIAFAGWFSPHAEFASMFKHAAKRASGEALE